MKKKLIVLIPCIVIVFIAILSTISNESQLYTSNIDGIDGLAFYTQTEEGSDEYNSVDTIPGKNDGYRFKEAVCNDNSNLTFNSTDWSISVSNMEEGKVRCKLYFDLYSTPAKDYILSQNTVNEGTPDFSTTATTDEGIFMAEDNDGTSYYYRGDVEDNYFYFAGYYWRIVRINGDGSIRLIYQGTSAGATGNNASAFSSAWNSTVNDNAYIGFMYGTPGSSTFDATHANANDTTIKAGLDDWYEDNLMEYSEYLADAGFCGDRQVSSGSGIGTSATTYLASTRLGNHNPTLKCTSENDLYTLSSSDSGNKALTYPIGLITADEVAFAGGVTDGSSSGTTNQSFYLYTGVVWRTMTPQSYGTWNSVNYPKVFGIDASGVLRWIQGASTEYTVRPVINISKDVELEGDGSASNPFKLTTEEIKVSAKEYLLANYPTVLTRTNFNSTVTTTTTGTIYRSADSSQYDEDGEVYYFAGNSTDNWLRFAGFYWRIIRINGDGSIRLIYQGTSANTTGSGTQIQTSAFNSASSQSRYVGLVYGSTSQQHGTGNNSTIMTGLNDWYYDNLRGYADAIDTGAGFCSDRGPDSGWSNSSTFYYAPYTRISSNTPSLDCGDADILSVDNGRLTYPIGLITVDEAAYAGGYASGNSSYYLYTGEDYWTMSPYRYNGTYASVFIIESSGYIEYDGATGNNSVRPVINLKADTRFEEGGTGTAGNPYVVITT